ncbi:MAG: class I SAM-dependent rRNA methyltransferase [Lachnospiraceae bacterium]|nr:class I SAM-dependent rRNA methyltransferase [Lachnospiraceae bacterium]
MKQQRPYPILTVSKKAERSIQNGHPWVYDAEIRQVIGTLSNGCLVDVLSDSANQDPRQKQSEDKSFVNSSGSTKNETQHQKMGKYLGTGFYSEHSKIRIRLISRNANDKFDAAFWARRIRYAWEYRKTVMGADIDCCRIIYGEADQFPGLTVDRFHDILVTQTLSYGMELLKPVIFPLLYQTLTDDGQIIRGIYERNDVSIRELEGLRQYKGWYSLDLADKTMNEHANPFPTSKTMNEYANPFPKSKDTDGHNDTQKDQGEEGQRPAALSCLTEITENGIIYQVDVENGQKTGFFLDQKYNRQAVARLAAGKHVLDCFTHTGSFALNAAKGGAASVCAVDISQTAIDMARRNAERNGLADRMTFRVANVFDLLPQLEHSHEEKYDFIILDPPAFTKSRRTVDSAKKGYKEINLRAMKILPRGGYLATCSCSHFMPDELFIKMLHSAAADAGVQLRQIEARQQAPDHPILWNVPETDYLKFYLFQVI